MGMFRSLRDGEAEGMSPERRRRIKLVFIGVIFAALLGVLPGVAPRIFAGTTAFPVMMFAFFASLAVASVFAGSRRSSEPGEKRKRGLDGEDMYTLIDRMVDELDEDEVDYLYRRLDQREHGSKNDVAESLGELLDQREEYRESGRR